MFKPLALFIGLRYTRAKRSNHFVSFISVLSMVGICLGVATLITVLSVMNGFDEEIHNRFFSMVPEITVRSQNNQMDNWPKVRQIVLKEKQVKGVSPYLADQGMLSHFGQSQPVFVTGIEPEIEGSVTKLSDKMITGKLADLKAGEFGIIIGETIADNLGLNIGDRINVIIPQATITPVGMLPRYKAFKVVGVFSAGPGFGFNKSLTYIHLDDARKFFQAGNNVGGLRVKIDNVYSAPLLARALESKIDERYYVGDWTQDAGAFFRAIKLEKTMMFLILSLIVAVAAFNLVSSLVMIVNDKQADIAILRTFGALPRTVLSIFMIQGLIVGMVGTLLGLILGLLIANHATEIVNFLQSVFNTQFISAKVYFIDYLPSKILTSDIVKICGSALVMSFVATIYPAWKAASIQPAEALRYE